MEGKRVAPPEPGAGKKSRKAAFITVGLIAALAAVLAGFCFYANLYTGIFPGVTAAWGQVELAGLTREEAAAKLEQELPAVLDAVTHQVELDGEILGVYSMRDIGYSPSTDAMVSRAWAVGRDKSGPIGWLMSGLTYVKGLLGAGLDLSMYLDHDESKMQTVIDQVAQMVDRPSIDGSYELTREGLYATKHQDGLAVDQDALRVMLSGISADGGSGHLECPVTELPAAPLDVEAMAAALVAEATPTRYDIQLGKVVDGTVGVEMEVEAARYVLEAAAAGETILLPATVTYPEMTAQELEAVLFRDLLGTTTTSVSGTSARRGNVKLAGAAVNGTVLNAGDIFDYNLVVGERTEERGYGAAATYVNGETVDTVGGGICQVSSTVYLASLLSNLEIVERYAHRFYPGYITLGMDATVSWGGPEFRFKNNTGYPIRIDVTYENSKLTVSIYGTKTDDTYVKMTREVLSTTGYETEYVETQELPWGTQKQKQNGYTGYKVESYRNVYDGNDNLISSTLESKSDYKSRNEIILVGIAGRPEDPQPPNGGGDTGGQEEPTLPPAGGDASGSGDAAAGDDEIPAWLRPAG